MKYVDSSADFKHFGFIITYSNSHMALFEILLCICEYL